MRSPEVWYSAAPAGLRAAPRRGVQPAVPQRQRGVEGRLLDVLQQSVGVHVQRRGAESYGVCDVARGGHGEQSGGDSLVHVGGCLPGRHVEGQLIDHGLQRVGCRPAGGMVRQLQICAGGRAL